MSGMDVSIAENLRQSWQKLSDRFDQLSKREKYVLLGVSVIISVMLWQTLLLDPLLADRSKRSELVAQINDEKNTMVNELTIINAQLQVDPHIEKKRHLQKLGDTIKATEQQLLSTTQALIPPQLMPQAIEELFQRFAGLKLLNMSNLPAQPLMIEKAKPAASTRVATASAGEKKPAVEATGLYRHAVEIVFSGDFRHTLEFLKALESMSWRFLWNSLQYEVQSYPDATIKLQIYTFSTSQEWIGV